jgi:Fe-S oxidoreductase
MSPIAMLALLVVAFGVFGWSALGRFRLLLVGRPANRFDRIGDRVAAVWRYAFQQEKMDYYQPAGWAHKLIFFGFITLLFRTLVLWGRGFYAPWNLFILAPYSTIGSAYEFLKDVVACLVLLGVSVFFYFRLIRPQKRMTLHWEGVLILCIIATMMLADMTYDGATTLLAAHNVEWCSGKAPIALCPAISHVVAPLLPPDAAMGTAPVVAHGGHYDFWPSPAGSIFAVMFAGLGALPLLILAHAGFWIHSALVLVFLNLLPHSKHFHVITAIPNVFFRDLTPAGRLKPMAENVEKIEEIMMTTAELPDPVGAPVGAGRIQHFTWKAILDFYTCTECGRCSDNCPAHKTGKMLSPKQLTLDLRDHLYKEEKPLVADEARKKKASPTHASPASSEGKTEEQASEGAAATELPEQAAADAAAAPAEVAPLAIDLVDGIIHPDVLWACTTCRACEEQCPVMISYVDKIVDMRRNLVLVKGEVPGQLSSTFGKIESNGNPWGLSRMDRGQWSDGLGIKMMAEHPTAPVLFWVGCSASYDDRAKKIARATASLLQQAGVDFAILGQEENCTGDPARRGGNEHLFATLAEGNAATLNGYKDQGGIKQVVTTCPHCFNTLKNEYPDFGAKLEVIHHTDFLLGLLAEKRLVPATGVDAEVVYHDSCYLGRYNGIYESPREILRRIPGVKLVEAEYWNKSRGLCCGAGGAQMWMEEQNNNRVNVKRTLQLIDAFDRGSHTHANKTVASACPFCMTMLTDGLKSQELESKIAQMDVAEILERSCRQVVEIPEQAAAE